MGIHPLRALTARRSIASSWRAVALLLLAGGPGSSAFVWPIENVYPAGEYKFTFSELYMYSAADAPLGITEFEPNIEINLQVCALFPCCAEGPRTMCPCSVDYPPPPFRAPISPP
jgi:hypothetical protein